MNHCLQTIVNDAEFYIIQTYMINTIAYSIDYIKVIDIDMWIESFHDYYFKFKFQINYIIKENSISSSAKIITSDIPIEFVIHIKDKFLHIICDPVISGLLIGIKNNVHMIKQMH